VLVALPDDCVFACACVVARARANIRSPNRDESDKLVKIFIWADAVMLCIISVASVARPTPTRAAIRLLIVHSANFVL